MAAPFPYARAQEPSFGAPIPMTAPSGPALTQLTARFDQMDQQIRTLTGKVEELQNAQDTAKRDTDKRLVALEMNVTTTTPQTGTSVTTPPPCPTTSVTGCMPPPVKTTTGAVSTTTSTTTVKTTPDAAPTTTTITVPSASEAPVPVTDTGGAPDDKAPLAAAPSVKPLGAVTSDGKAQPGTPEASYEAAFTLLQNKDYPAAETAFRNFVKANPTHDLAGNAQYWLGETYYARQDYKNAAKSFAEGYQKYRKAPKAADNLVKLGLSLEALGNKDDACVTYGQFKKEYQDAAPALKAKADAEIKKLGCAA